MSKVQYLALFSYLFFILGFIFSWLSYQNYLRRKSEKFDIINYIFSFFTELGFGPAAILSFIISTVGFISLFRHSS
jgi:hypothetical protein